jgi:hypothetical protein
MVFYVKLCSAVAAILDFRSAQKKIKIGKGPPKFYACIIFFIYKCMLQKGTGQKLPGQKPSGQEPPDKKLP